MRKTILYLVIASFVFTFSGCTKEQTLLNLLHGTWKLTGQLDDDGDPVTANPNCTVEVLVSFFLCDDNDQDDCDVVTKTTTTCVGSNSVISASDSRYSVFGKTQLIWGGTVYEIESVSKKELKIHRASSPKATSTYEKE